MSAKLLSFDIDETLVEEILKQYKEEKTLTQEEMAWQFRRLSKRKEVEKGNV